VVGFRIKTTDGLAQAEAAKVRLTNRIGALTPPQPGRTDLAPTSNESVRGLSPMDLSRARKLASDPEAVEDYLQEHTDDNNPPSLDLSRLAGAPPGTPAIGPTARP